MAISANDIQALYIAYFNRPADFLGLQFWQDAANKAGSVAVVANEFSKSAEYTDLYANKSAAEIVDTIYMNLFGRHAEPDGISFWGSALQRGAINVGNAAYQIFKGAQNADLVAVNSKVQAATAFYAALDTGPEIVGYSGSAANAVVKQWLSGIVDANTLAAATTADALATVTAAAVAAHDGSTNTGKAFATTLAIDTIVGTNGNDTINVYASGTKADGTDAGTLSANDSIDGGAGVDTLNLEVKAGMNDTQVGTIKNVEIINISNADLLAAGVIDATKYQGSTNINILSTSVAADVTVNGLAGKTLGIGAGFDGTKTVSADFAAATGNVALNNTANGVTVDLTNAKTTTLNLSGTNADDGAGGPGTITLANTGAKVANLNLNLKSDAIVSVAGLAALTTIASTGTFSVDLSDAANTVQSITTGGGDDTVAMSFVTAAAAGATAAKNATVSTGAGNDVITVTTTGTGLTTVDAGAGNDKITVTKLTGAALNITGGAGNDKVTILGNALETSDVIDGGDGTDTIAVAGSTTARVADDFIVLTKVIKNFESLELTSAEGTVGAAAATEIALDASKLAGYSTFTFDAAGSFVKNVAATQSIVEKGASLTATAAGYIAKGASGATSTTYAGTLNVTDKVAASTFTARADTVNLSVGTTDHNGAATPVGVTLTGDVKTANVTLTNGTETDATDGTVTHDDVASVSITTATTTSTFQNAVGSNTALGKLATLTLTGSGSATVVNADSTALTSVDASGLGGTYTVTADGHTKGDAVAGLTYTTTNTAVETIKLGAGIDTITFGAGSSTYGKVDTLTGLNLVLNTAGTALTAASDTLAVTGATSATKVTTTQTDIDLALKDFATAHVNGTVVFSFGGDTYVYHDNGATAADQGKVDASDILVKLTGTVNLDALVVALG